MIAAWLIVAPLLLHAAQVEDDAPLGLADLAAEHAALTGRSDASEPPKAVAYRELWDRPGAWRGRRVIIQGRVARVFRQAAVGSFPPLVEAWIEEPPGNLFCAVFASGAKDAPAIDSGASVVFTGTYLRRVRYAADDGGRLAPLIVGAEPPRVETPARVEPLDFEPDAAVSVWSDSKWAVGLFIGLAGTGVILAWRTLNRPAPVRGGRRAAAAEPEPEFLDQEREPADGDSR